MARKERNQEKIVIPVEHVVQPPAEVDKEYESVAYGAPSPEVGSDVTVMKPVGIGGPVPIVAPKHNTIQLQPIIVPLAVVPYMTQDSNVLRTDGRQQIGGAYQSGGTYQLEDEEFGNSAQFEDVAFEKRENKRRDFRPRLFAAISVLLTLVLALPFLLSHVKGDIGNMHITTFNIIGIITTWVKNGFSWSPASNLIYVVVAFLAAIQVVMALVGLVIGKYPKPLGPILAFIDIGCMIGLLIAELVNTEFKAKDNVGMLVILSVAALNFIVALVFSIVLNKIEDHAEARAKNESAI